MKERIQKLFCEKKSSEAQVQNDEVTAAKWYWQYSIGSLLQWYLPSLTVVILVSRNKQVGFYVYIW